MSLSLKLSKLTTFIQNRISLKTFVESQFEVIEVYHFQTKGNSSEDICWFAVWRYVSLWVSNKSKFLWRYLLSLSLKLCRLMSLKQKGIRMKTFVESQFEIMSVYEFQTKANSHEDNCWASFWSYVSLWVSNKIEDWWRHLLSLSWRLCKFMSFQQKWILMNKFVES